MRLDDLRPGWQSDFFLHRRGALISERDDCIVVRTPHNPTFYWGNFLLLPQAPADGDVAHWCARFEAEIGALQPASLHLAIGVNAAPAGQALPAWTARGFDRFDSALLALEPAGLRAPTKAPRGALRLAQFDLRRDIDALIELECADTHGFDPAGYATHRRQQMQRHAAMALDDEAAWFGVWCDDVLAAACGLMRGPAGRSGRFQHVATHPAWRRRGLCSALVHGVSAWGFDEWKLQRLLMCADPDDVAITIYESLGYRRVDGHWGLQRVAPQDHAAHRAGAPS